MIEKLSHYTLILFFMLLICLGMLATVFKEKKEISELENRYLAKLPNYSLSIILDGSFSDSMEKYVGDHFILRDLMIEKFTDLQLRLGRKEVNKITIINNMLLPELIDPPSLSTINRYIISLDNFSRKNKNNEVFLYLLPFKTTVLKELYPEHYNYKKIKKSGRDIFISELYKTEHNFHVFDLYKLWKKRYTFPEMRDFYFLSDHHWNHEGAFIAYHDIISNLKDNVSFNLGEPYLKEDLTFECFNHVKFLGSYHKKLYYLGEFGEEVVCRYVVENAPGFTRYDNKAKKTNFTYRETFYSRIDNNTDFVDYWSLYSPTLGLLKFENDNAPNNLKALIIRDSYSNPLLPLMAKHFNTLYVIDPRHLKLDSIEKFIKENSINLTLLLYNDNNFHEEFYDF